MPFLLHGPPTPLPSRADEPGGPRHLGASVDKSFRSGPECLAWVRARASCPAKEKSVVCYRASKSNPIPHFTDGRPEEWRLYEGYTAVLESLGTSVFSRVQRNRCR